MKLGVIADDFTGAVDVAGFIRNGGIETIMFCGLPSYEDLNSIDEDSAVVISLQIRSCSVKLATAQAVAAVSMLKKTGCRKFYFKYCSTFDCTEYGNIGPVAESIMKLLDSRYTVFVPALPVNGRTVYKGYLFVNDRLLSESPMRFHPVNPMTESYIPTLLEKQFSGKIAVIPYEDISKGSTYVRRKLNEYTSTGVCGIVIDSIDDKSIRIIAEACSENDFLTGGSALAGALASVLSNSNYNADGHDNIPFRDERTVIFVGSCSRASNIQVNNYIAAGAPAKSIDITELIKDLIEYARKISDWIATSSGSFSPMVYATKSPEELDRVNALYPDYDIAALINEFFRELTCLAIGKGFRRFIVGGGETSGAVVQASGERLFRIGPEISPGISWIYSRNMAFALKSGNFGKDTFFLDVQR